jgi:hypothetical protein
LTLALRRTFSDRFRTYPEGRTMKIFGRSQIVDAVDVMRATGMDKDGFIALSQGRIQMPPVQNLECLYKPMETAA